MFDALRVHVDAFGQDATKSLDLASKFGKFLVEVRGRRAKPPKFLVQSVLANVYGGHGPLRTGTTSVNCAAI